MLVVAFLVVVLLAPAEANENDTWIETGYAVIAPFREDNEYFYYTRAWTDSDLAIHLFDDSERPRWELLASSTVDRPQPSTPGVMTVRENKRDTEPAGMASDHDDIPPHAAVTRVVSTTLRM